MVNFLVALWLTFVTIGGFLGPYLLWNTYGAWWGAPAIIVGWLLIWLSYLAAGFK